MQKPAYQKDGKIARKLSAELSAYAETCLPERWEKYGVKNAKKT
jgi:hypothetical protein